MSVPQDAVEAAISALKPSLNPNALYPCIEGLHRDVANALTAALPALEQQIRAQVAQEIVTAAADTYGTTVLDARMFEGQWDAIKLAAQIARGVDQP